MASRRFEPPLTLRARVLWPLGVGLRRAASCALGVAPLESRLSGGSAGSFPASSCRTSLLAAAWPAFRDAALGVTRAVVAGVAGVAAAVNLT